MYLLNKVHFQKGRMTEQEKSEEILSKRVMLRQFVDELESLVEKYDFGEPHSLEFSTKSGIILARRDHERLGKEFPSILRGECFGTKESQYHEVEGLDLYVAIRMFNCEHYLPAQK